MKILSTILLWILGLRFYVRTDYKNMATLTIRKWFYEDALVLTIIDMDRLDARIWNWTGKPYCIKTKRWHPSGAHITIPRLLLPVAKEKIARWCGDFSELSTASRKIARAAYPYGHEAS